MRTLFLFTLMLFVLIFSSLCHARDYNYFSDPSIYFGGGVYRPYSQGFEQDLLAGNDDAYNKALNNQYSYTPSGSGSQTQNGVPNVVWVSPYNSHTPY